MKKTFYISILVGFLLILSGTGEAFAKKAGLRCSKRVSSFVSRGVDFPILECGDLPPYFCEIALLELLMKKYPGTLDQDAGDAECRALGGGPKWRYTAISTE